MDTITRMQRKLSELDFDFSTFTIESFAQFVGQHAGTNIQFIGWDMPPGLFGAWVSLKDSPRDYVFYNKTSPPLLQIHTKLHELGHILNGHATLSVTLDELRESIKTNQLNYLFKNSLLRGESGEQTTTAERLQMEAEAETVAELVQTEVFGNEAMMHLLTTESSYEEADAYLSHLGLKQ